MALSEISYNVRVYAMWRNDTIFLIIAPYGRGFSRAAYTLLGDFGFEFFRFMLEFDLIISLQMKPAIERYQEMLHELAVPTPVFHEILGALLKEGASEEVLEHMDGLLHMPNFGPVQWEQNAVQLACRNLIATVTEHESMEAYLPDEPPQEWNVLANRVIEKRKTGVA